MPTYRSLTRPDDFRRVLARGRRIQAEGLGISVWHRPEDGAGLRLGMAVSSRSAVTRNRARRRIRAALRSVIVASPDLDLLVRGDERAASIPFQELEKHLRRALGVRP